MSPALVLSPKPPLSEAHPQNERGFILGERTHRRGHIPGIHPSFPSALQHRPNRMRDSAKRRFSRSFVEVVLLVAQDLSKLSKSHDRRFQPVPPQPTPRRLRDLALSAVHGGNPPGQNHHGPAIAALDFARFIGRAADHGIRLFRPPALFRAQIAYRRPGASGFSAANRRKTSHDGKTGPKVPTPTRSARTAQSGASIRWLLGSPQTPAARPPAPLVF
jgi:hypothetical protein